MMQPFNSLQWISRLLCLIPLVSGCAMKPPCLQSVVDAPAVPPLPIQARQAPAPPWCFPTCSSALTGERVNWQKRMTRPE